MVLRRGNETLTLPLLRVEEDNRMGNVRWGGVPGLWGFYALGILQQSWNTGTLTVTDTFKGRGE